MNEECDDSIRDLIEEEKRTIDDKVDKSKFSFIVIKSQFYKELIEAMHNFNSQLKGDIQKGSS
jgi:hypothetical protein